MFCAALPQKAAVRRNAQGDSPLPRVSRRRLLRAKPPVLLRKLLTQVQLSDQRTITLDVGLLQVLQQTTATAAPSAADHGLEWWSLRLVFRCSFRWLMPVGQQGNLHFGRTGVAFMLSVGGNDFALGHGISSSKFLFRAMPWAIACSRSAPSESSVVRANGSQTHPLLYQIFSRL